MLTSLMVIGNHHSNEILTALDKSCQAEVIRIDLAWPLFLSKSGFDSNGLIDIPQGNPRSKWFSLNQWFRQSLGNAVDTMTESTRCMIALVPPCTPAALEYVSRMLSIYSTELGLLDLRSIACPPEEVAKQATLFFSGSPTESVKEAWVPPILHLAGEETPLQKKMGKNQNGSSFTWLTGILGSDRLFSQVYHLAPGAGGNRLHAHSDVDEMYVVLKGNGELITNRGSHPLREGDVIGKPSGSGLSTQFVAGKDGMTVLDVEAWTRSDQTDVVYYPEHREMLLRGRGLNHATAVENLFSGDEIMSRYAEDYKRNKDGTVDE